MSRDLLERQLWTGQLVEDFGTGRAGHVGGLRPPVPYYGGKIRLARRLVALMVPHRVYLEPFFGSGAVFFAKHPARVEIINDLDQAVVTFMRILRDRPEDLTRVCALTPHSRAEFDAADLAAEGLEELELARRFWVRTNQGFAKSLSTRTGWSITTARHQSIPASMQTRLTRFEACARRLVGTSIESCDALSLIDRLATADTLVYADPPYLASTRSNCSELGPGDYRFDTRTEADHRALAEVLHATPATVLLSGYPSELYDELYHDWPQVSFNMTVSSSNAMTRTRATRPETVWSNRALPIGEQLQLEIS